MPKAQADGGWTDERSAAGKRNPWLIVGVISLATFMEVLDTSIANVSLTHIAGGLSASTDEAAWVLTSYLVSNAVIIPISGFLSDVIGRKRYYMLSVFLFTISSLCCGLAPSLPLLIAARIFQGIGGGGLAPSEQSILADTFPPAKRGQAFAAYGIVVVVGPVLGPTLGGWITDNISWHWIFLINVPVGILSLFLVNSLVVEPEILVKERKARLKKGVSVDFIGFLFIVLGLGCLELTLDRGERDDWFASPFICATAIISGVSLFLLVIWETRHKEPMLDVSLLGRRNFGISTLFMLATGLVLFSTTAIIPQMLQEVLGYNATDAGLAMTTGGIATLVTMPIVGQLAGRVDPRLLMIPALLLQAFALFYMSGWNANISFAEASHGRLISALGLPFLFIPISTVAYVGLKPTQTNQASAMLNVARNLGGSIGISAAQALVIERGQVHQSRIVETLSPLNPNYVDGLNQIQQALSGAANAAGAEIGVLASQVATQSEMLAFIDLFRIFMWVTLAICPLGLLLKPGKGPAGAAH